MTSTLVLAMVIASLWGTACSAQENALPVTIHLDPMMTRGPAAAPVTIVEFSDYE
ncbi:MAG: hypothetical protein L0027_18375 [Candidatus Rokubacteria bacterium]|nr:hypothetical protein [Candidatus Rokubacteria bacterium]